MFRFLVRSLASPIAMFHCIANIFFSTHVFICSAVNVRKMDKSSTSQGDSSYSTRIGLSLASRVEESSKNRSRANKLKRKHCEHCNQDLTTKTFKKHRNLYFRDDGTWISASSVTSSKLESKYPEVKNCDTVRSHFNMRYNQ